MSKRKLWVYIACSVDGYIADEQGELNFLNAVHVEGEDYGYADFMQGIDTVLVGRNTYDWLKQRGHDFPHRQLESYVITSRAQAPEDKVQFYTSDLQRLVLDLKSQDGKGIFCDGGAQLVHQLLQMELVDECIISTIPILLGGGKRLFQSGFSQQKLDLQSVRSFSSGLVQSHYRVKS